MSKCNIIIDICLKIESSILLQLQANYMTDI